MNFSRTRGRKKFTRTAAAAGIDTGAVLAWGMPRLRDLPWRRVRDPWAILVAEVMLQQTQAPRVVPKWEAFLASFPTTRACADAPLGDVLRLWHGLGYPRRARNLHLAARHIVDRNGGVVPDALDELLALPGVGAYTARAVLAFAYEQDVAVADTNIGRVLARTGGARLTTKGAQAAADALVPRGEGWAWNQILMDLGATLCRPTPTCAECPVESTCRWRQRGWPSPDPAIGSAGVSGKQSRFEGSDRQARGRVLAALVDRAEPAIHFDQRILAGLVADGLVVLEAGTASLP